MKKKINIDAISNELEGASLFFTRQAQKPVIDESSPPLTRVPVELDLPKVQPQKKLVVNKKQVKAVKKSKRDTTIPRNRDTMVSRYHDTIIELVRRAVKELGKEAATHRFTQAEKRAVADIIYTYKNQGLRTSENEIARIAVNFLIEDYKQNGKESVLDKALRALNQ